MKGAFISPEVYQEVFSSLCRKKKFSSIPSVDHIWDQFSQSPYRKLLLPFSWVKQNPDFCKKTKNFVLVVRPHELAPEVPEGPWILLVESVRDFKRLATVPTSALEIVFLVTSSLSKSDLSSMSQDTKVKWLFSYKISHEDLQKNLQLIRSMGLPLQTSDFLELSCEESLDNWYSPKISDIQSNASEASINTSIIVPFQDNYDEVLQTLPLLIQSLKDEASTEIIVANDSFSLEQENRILEILKSDARYFTYLKIERSKPRVKGDAQFRAGVVRNLATYLAQGQELIFLDSDIIVGKNLWTAIHTARKTHNGALMPRRHFLRSDIENSSLSYELIQKGCHTQLSWGGHWEDFYRNSHVPDSWKWTSTYCLALPRALFDEVGGFGRAFSSYGFEDTDLGYRLLRHGQSLQVLNQDVFHLPFPASRSEYASHFEERKKLLKKSFGAFLRSSMNPDLLSQFRHILN